MTRGLCLAFACTATSAADDWAIAGAEAADWPTIPTLSRETAMRPARLERSLLSPDGQYVAYLRRDQDQRSLWWRPLDNGEPVRLLPRLDDASLRWSPDGRWLFVLTPTQLMAFDREAAGAGEILARWQDRRSRTLLDTGPGKPDAVLLHEQSPDGAVPWRTAVWRWRADGEAVKLHESDRPILDVLLTPDGELAWLRQAEAARHVVYQADAGGRLHERFDCTNLHRCRLLARDGEDGLWLLGDLGADLQQLQRYSPEHGVVAIAPDPRAEADLDQVVFDHQTREPVLLAWRSTQPHWLARNPDVHKALSQLEQALPDSDLSLQLGPSAKAPWWVEQRVATRAGVRTWRFDPLAGHLESFDLVPDAATPAQPPRRPVRWTASDGRELHGFLTLPAGRDASKVPLVVSVHGGPWSAARPGHSPFAALLASRGVAVFEPNFRGSTGFGREMLLAPGGDFGNGRVQQDIDEGAQVVLSRGIGDPQRVAIVGASFGGYSALLGVTFSPQRYRLALAAVPPTDFGWTLRWAVHNSDLSLQAGVPLATTFALLGVDPEDPGVIKSLAAQSPLAHAERLTRPVLLFAGGRDERVAFRGVSHYAATLALLGKDVSLFVEPDAGHGMDDPLTREAWLYLVEGALHRHLGSDPPEPPSPALEAYLARSLRLRGSVLPGPP
ncbi:S9 family peptidase [Arenimonas aestuarii]